jgi:VCBS repeat-containing protein
MRDAGYFSKLRSFLLRGSTHRRREARGRARPSRTQRVSPFNLEPLEPRVLLAADLAGAVQAAQIVEPAPQESPAAAVALQEQTQTNQAPVAADDHIGEIRVRTSSDPRFVEVYEIHQLGLIGNDRDPDGDPLTIIAVTPTDETHGTASLNQFSNVEYIPDLNFSGIARFNYTVSDGRGGTDTATISIQVGSNQAPVANPDPYSVNEDTTLTVPTRGVLTNDTDANNNPLTATLVTGPSNGMLALNSDGGFTYTPNGNFNGSDSFTYKANDGTADSNVATVSIAVRAVNDPPTAADDTVTVEEDSGATAIPVLNNDSSGSDTSETLIISAVTQGTNGAIAITGNGTGLTYAPNANFFGNDAFTYTISDGNGGQATATVSVAVTSVNDAPIANPGPPQTVQGGVVTLDGTASSDLEQNTPLSFAWTLTGPTGSTAPLVNPTASRPTFTPNIAGDYTAKLIVTDTLGRASAPAEVKISVIPMTVNIDIKPGDDTNTINLGAGGTTPVAILSTQIFDATTVNPNTVTLSSAPVNLRGRGEAQASREDVNRDGREDLVVHVITQDLELSQTAQEAVLEGRTFGGIFIRGTDSIRVVA